MQTNLSKNEMYFWPLKRKQSKKNKNLKRVHAKINSFHKNTPLKGLLQQTQKCFRCQQESRENCDADEDRLRTNEGGNIESCFYDCINIRHFLGGQPLTISVDPHVLGGTNSICETGIQKQRLGFLTNLDARQIGALSEEISGDLGLLYVGAESLETIRQNVCETREKSESGCFVYCLAYQLEDISVTNPPTKKDWEALVQENKRIWNCFLRKKIAFWSKRGFLTITGQNQKVHD